MLSTKFQRQRRALRRVWRFLRSDDGPAAVEYAVMLALILGVCIATISTFGNQTGGSFRRSLEEIGGRMSYANDNR